MGYVEDGSHKWCQLVVMMVRQNLLQEKENGMFGASSFVSFGCYGGARTPLMSSQNQRNSL